MAICLETREKTYKASTKIDSISYSCTATDRKEYDSHMIVCDVCGAFSVHSQNSLDFDSLTVRFDVHERRSDWSVLSCYGSISPITPAGYSIPDRTIRLSNDLDWDEKRFVVAIGMALYCVFTPSGRSEDKLADWLQIISSQLETFGHDFAKLLGAQTGCYVGSWPLAPSSSPLPKGGLE